MVVVVTTIRRNELKIQRGLAIAIRRAADVVIRVVVEVGGSGVFGDILWPNIVRCCCDLTAVVFNTDHGPAVENTNVKSKEKLAVDLYFSSFQFTNMISVNSGPYTTTFVIKAL